MQPLDIIMWLVAKVKAGFDISNPVTLQFCFCGSDSVSIMNSSWESRRKENDPYSEFLDVDGEPTVQKVPNPGFFLLFQPSEPCTGPGIWISEALISNPPCDSSPCCLQQSCSMLVWLHPCSSPAPCYACFIPATVLLHARLTTFPKTLRTMYST